MALTPVENQTPAFTAGVSAAAGGFAGLFVGTAQGSGLMGILIGAALMAVIGFICAGITDKEKPVRWALLAAFTVAGFALGGLPTLCWAFCSACSSGWFAFWLATSRYRAHLAPYLTPGQVLWHYTFRVICGAIFVFLITPILVVMPLSFNAQDFFTFTPEMLRFDPEG